MNQQLKKSFSKLALFHYYFACYRIAAHFSSKIDGVSFCKIVMTKRCYKI